MDAHSSRVKMNINIILKDPYNFSYSDTQAAFQMLSIHLVQQLHRVILSATPNLTSLQLACKDILE